MAARRSVTTLALLAGLVLLFPGTSAAVEEILDWHSDIEVASDGSMTVTETIKVRAEGDQIKRGIYRDFPITYRDRAGNRVTIGFDLLSVERDGHPEPYHTESLSNGVRVYLGQKSVFLKPAEYTYTISYRTDRQLGFFESHDELYWNVTGNGWDFVIREATATVTLPEPVSSDVLRMEGYVGPQGSRDRNVTWEAAGPGKARFTGGRPLNSREGLTIVLGWPKGVIAEPDRTEKTRQFLGDNGHLVSSVAGLVLLILYYVIVWIKVGKDPEKGTVIPQFTPPGDMSPAAMRYIMEMGFDDRTLASAIINLAVKGYITIHDDTKALGLIRTYTLKRTSKEPKAALSKGEQKIARKLFPGNSMTLKLEQKNHQKISGAVEALKEMLEGEYRKAHFANNAGYMVPGVLITLAALFLSGFTGRMRPGGPPTLFIVLWLMPWSIATFALWKTRKYFMAAIFTFFLVMATSAFGASTSFVFIATIFLYVAVNIVFYLLLKAPTSLGRRVMDKVEGFKMYLSTAEEHRLEKLHPPDKTPELFEKYLPYALALEVDQQWSEKFAGVLYRAAAHEDYSPSWYHGRHWDGMNTGQFSSNLASSFSSAISSSAQAPGSSSGFGGGGSSGGGGGGGGGGGW
ncbi:MAG: DUF2207 domain-containing protein [bacterium]|nr:DUF2207 domain-containing protein [bacterium]MDT8395417.1 DUF2207 domain-containing protein [bacterium]